MQTSGGRQRRWQLSKAGSRYPCRHCDGVIGLDDVSLVERERPWIVLHASCVDSLAATLYLNVLDIEQATELSDDEAFRLAIEQRSFLAAAAEWGEDNRFIAPDKMWRHWVAEAKKKLDALLLRGLGFASSVDEEPSADPHADEPSD